MLDFNVLRLEQGFALNSLSRNTTTGVAKAEPSVLARHAKLVDSAQQFEGVMLEEMLKPMHFGAPPDADGEESTGAQATVASFGTEAMAHALAMKGGFGIAQRIIRQVSAEDESLKLRSGGTKV